MAKVWIIDAFNLLRKSSHLIFLESKNFNRAIDGLIQQLADFKSLQQDSVICVFDAAKSISHHRQYDKQHGIEIIYTRSAESADEHIIELCEHYKQRAIVVSSDREVQNLSKSHGALVMSSEHFWSHHKKIKMQQFEVKEEESFFDPKKGTKKKGPSKRRPKKERQLRAKLGYFD